MLGITNRDTINRLEDICRSKLLEIDTQKHRDMKQREGRGSLEIAQAKGGSKSHDEYRGSKKELDLPASEKSNQIRNIDDEQTKEKKSRGKRIKESHENDLQTTKQKTHKERDKKSGKKKQGKDNEFEEIESQNKKVQDKIKDNTQEESKYVENSKKWVVKQSNNQNQLDRQHVKTNTPKVESLSEKIEVDSGSRFLSVLDFQLIKLFFFSFLFLLNITMIRF